MDSLLSAFRAEAPPPLQAASGEPLSKALQDLVARGVAAWPAIEVDGAALVAQAARHLPAATASADLPATLAKLHAADLHLSCACAAGSAVALATFDRTLLGGALAAALARLDRSPAFFDEVLQAVRAKLFLARPGAAPRIAGYSGRWPLSTWLRTIAVRTAIDLRRSGGLANVAGEAPGDDLSSGDSPELLYLKDRTGAAFRQAISAAFAALDGEQRQVLRLQIVDGLRTAQIAALLRLDRATIKRRLAICRQTLMAETRRHLQEALSLSPAELDSLAAVVQSQLHVSMVRLLRSAP